VAFGNDGNLYLSTTGNFSVPAVSGQGRDVFVFNPTTGFYSPTLFFDGSAAGLGTALVDGFEVF